MATYSTNYNDSDQNSHTEHGQPCEISLCGMEASEAVDHPQRGEMDVCKTHAKRIRALPKWRFIGVQEVAQ